MKDYLRDYSTAAFRFYAMNGRSAEKFKQKIYLEALVEHKNGDGSSGISKPTEAAIMAAERAVNEKLAEISDMESVDKVIAELEVKHREDIIKAIEFVYFKDSDKEFNIGDIQDRVHNAAIHIPAGERSIYRWLRQARQLFAIERGLRAY
jgi:hypothetical protein